MSTKEQTPWPLDRLAEALGSTPQPLTDARHGAGIGLRVGRPPHELRLVVYPEAQLVKLRAPAIALDLQQPEPPRVGTNSVSFRAPLEPDTPQAEAYRLVVKATGHFFLTFAPGILGLVHETAPEPPPQTLQDDPGATDNPEAVLEAPPRASPARRARRRGQRRQGNDTTPAIASTTAAPEEAATPPPEQAPRERLTLTGRVGRPPQRYTTQSNQLVAHFPLAVREADAGDATTWYRVRAFDERAHAVLQLRQGQLVTIVGYPHQATRKRPTKEHPEQTQTITEIYVAAVRRPPSPARPPKRSKE